MVFAAVLSQCVMTIFLSLHGTVLQTLIVGALPFFTVMTFAYTYLTQVEVFRFAKKPTPVTLPKEGDWLTVFKNAYVHQSLRELN